jgi:hypothetical protein
VVLAHRCWMETNQPGSFGLRLQAFWHHPSTIGCHQLPSHSGHAQAMLAAVLSAGHCDAESLLDAYCREPLRRYMAVAIRKSCGSWSATYNSSHSLSVVMSGCRQAGRAVSPCFGLMVENIFSADQQTINTWLLTPVEPPICNHAHSLIPRHCSGVPSFCCCSAAAAAADRI